LHPCEHDAALIIVVRCGHETRYDAYADVTHCVIAAVSCSAAATTAAVGDTSHERLDRRRRGAVKTGCLRSVEAQLTFNLIICVLNGKGTSYIIIIIIIIIDQLHSP